MNMETGSRIEPNVMPVAADDARDVERWLVGKLASRLSIAPDRVDRNGPILHLGLDSMDAMEILGDIEETCKVVLDAEELFDEDPSVAEIAERIARAMGADAAPLTRETSPVQVARARPPKPGRKRERHPYAEYVNPYLGEMLARLEMDKEFVRGEGCYLEASDGRQYLDFVAMYGALPFGFNPPEIWGAVEAVKSSFEPSFVQPSALAAAGELARRLVSAAPGDLALVTFSNSGAEAIEAAIKLCRAATGRLGILTTSGSFHGKTLGALSATGNPRYQSDFGAPAPHFDTVPFGDIDALEEALERAPGRYAAFIVEPIQGEGGIVEPPKGYLLRAQEAVKRAGALFVVDEVQTGLGRTGAMFASESEGLSPDVMTLAKALGGGLVPIGATLCRKEIYTEAFATKHSSTFAGGTLACRVGLAALDLLEKDDRELVANVAGNGARLKEKLDEIVRRHPEILGSVRGRGYLLGVELVADRSTWASSMLGYVAEQGLLAPLVASYLLNVEGVRTAPTLNGSNVLRIEPPLVATWKECERFLGAFERTVATLAEGNTAAMVAHLVGPERGRSTAPISSVPTVVRAARRPRPFRRDGDGRFAFLMHPLDLTSYGEFDPGLARLDRDQLGRLQERLLCELEPMAVSETVIESESGDRAFGELVVVPLDADELMRRRPEDVVSIVSNAARAAGERGAGIVGLGGFLSVATLGGLHLRSRGLPALTTGNSFTVVAAESSVRRACEERGVSREETTLAVVGASGAIGRAAALRLAGEFGRLVLVGNPKSAERSRRRLHDVASDLLLLLWRAESEVAPAPGSIAARLAGLRSTLSRDATRAELMAQVRATGILEGALAITTDLGAWLPGAGVVVTATSSTERLVGADDLGPDAIVCDLSRPSNVSEEVTVARPDVLVIEGGVVAAPGSPDLGCRFGLEPGHVYACMAETMLLALEKRYQDTSVGLNLDIATIGELEALSRKHGFRPRALTAAPRLAEAI